MNATGSADSRAPFLRDATLIYIVYPSIFRIYKYSRRRYLSPLPLPISIHAEQRFPFRAVDIYCSEIWLSRGRHLHLRPRI